MSKGLRGGWVCLKKYFRWKDCKNRTNYWTIPKHAKCYEIILTSVYLYVKKIAPWPSPRALLMGLQHCQLVEFCEFQVTFWLPWQHSGYHGNRSPCQQLLSHPMPLLIKFYSLLGVLWALGMFFGCHGNSCQGNQSLDIFQPLWSKGSPTRQISWRSGCKQCQESVTENGSVYIWYLYHDNDIDSFKLKVWNMSSPETHNSSLQMITSHWLIALQVACNYVLEIRYKKLVFHSYKHS